MPDHASHTPQVLYSDTVGFDLGSSHRVTIAAIEVAGATSITLTVDESFVCTVLDEHAARPRVGSVAPLTIGNSGAAFSSLSVIADALPLQLGVPAVVSGRYVSAFWKLSIPAGGVDAVAIVFTPGWIAVLVFVCFDVFFAACLCGLLFYGGVAVAAVGLAACGVCLAGSTGPCQTADGHCSDFTDASSSTCAAGLLDCSAVSATLAVATRGTCTTLPRHTSMHAW